MKFNILSVRTIGLEQKIYLNSNYDFMSSLLLMKMTRSMNTTKSHALPLYICMFIRTLFLYLYAVYDTDVYFMKIFLL